MKRIICVILSLLSFQTLIGCEREHETPERIMKHIAILEAELIKEEKQYLESNLVDIETPESVLNPNGEIPRGVPGIASWYDRNGKLEDAKGPAEGKYFLLSRGIVIKHTDGKLIGQYYTDDEFNVYYYGGREYGE